jgi:hypothetical protein
MKNHPVEKIAKDNSFFKKLDIFGISYNFLVNGNTKFKTNTGAMITIIYSLILCTLFMGFGVDLYERKRPKVSFNSQLEAYKEIKLTNQNFTYAYRIEDKDGLMKIDEKKIIQQVLYYHYVIENGGWKKKFEKILPNKRCSELTYTKEKEKAFDISLEKSFCIDFDNMIMGGNWDGNFVYGILIYTNQCKSEKGIICDSREEIKNLISPENSTNAVFYSDLSLEVDPSMDNFETPLKTSFVNRYELLNLGLSKRKVQTFKATTIVNDQGWLLSDIYEETVLSSDSIFPDFTLKDIWGQDLLYTQLIYYGRKQETYFRNYTKIQEVFAHIGGFSKLFYIVISSLYTITLDAYRNLYLISNIPVEVEKLQILQSLI